MLEHREGYIARRHDSAGCAALSNVLSHRPCWQLPRTIRNHGLGPLDSAAKSRWRFVGGLKTTAYCAS